MRSARHRNGIDSMHGAMLPWSLHPHSGRLYLITAAQQSAGTRYRSHLQLHTSQQLSLTGRGRFSREWKSPIGGVYATFALSLRTVLSPAVPLQLGVSRQFGPPSRTVAAHRRHPAYRTSRSCSASHRSTPWLTSAYAAGRVELAVRGGCVCAAQQCIGGGVTVRVNCTASRQVGRAFMVDCSRYAARSSAYGHCCIRHGPNRSSREYRCGLVSTLEVSLEYLSTVRSVEPVGERANQMAERHPDFGPEDRRHPCRGSV